MSIRQQIISMVAEAAGVDASAISGENELWRDLHIGGDEMLYLFLKMQKQFGVNLDGLDLKELSPNEDDVLLTQITEWVRKKFHRGSQTSYASVTVTDLVEAAESKRWSRRVN